MTDQGNDSCNIVIKEETEIFDYHIQDPEQNREYVLDNINDIKPELIQLSLADLDAQFKTWENFFREQNGLPEFYMGLNVNNVLVPHKIVPIGNGSSDFFYTLSFLIFHDFNHASFVRINVAQHVADNWDLFKEYAVDSNQRLYYSAEHYLNEMLKPDTPGRGCELLAAARLFATKFELYIDETLCFHCGMTATNVVRRIKVSPLEGSVHFDAYEPISDEEVKNFSGPRTLNAENSNDERMRKEFMKSVEKHLLKIIFPDFMIKTAAGDVEHKQVLLTSCTWKDYPDSNRHICYINRIRAQNKELEKRKNWATGPAGLPPSSQSSKKPSEIVTITIEDESESSVHPEQVEESETVREKDPLECSNSETRLSKIQQNKEIFRRWKQKEQNETSRRSTGKKQMENIAERQMPASELSQDGSQDSGPTSQVQSRQNMLGQDILLLENQPSRQKKSCTDPGQSENAIATPEKDASGRFLKKGAVRASTTDPDTLKKEQRRKQYAEKKNMQKATATRIPSAPQFAKSSQGVNAQSKSRTSVQKLQKPLGQGSSSSVVISSSTANKEQIEVWKSMPQKKFVILLLSENQNMGKTATIQLPGAKNSSKSSQDDNQHSVPLSSALQLRNILEPNTSSPDHQQRKNVEERLQSLLRENGKEFSREWNRLIRERERTERKEIAKIEKKFEGEIVQARIRKYEKRKREKAFPLSKSKKRASLTEKLKRKYENLRKYQTKKRDENEEKLKVTFKIHEDYKLKWVSYRNKKAAEIKALIDSGSAPPASETANVVPDVPGPTLELCDIKAITDDKPSQVKPLSQDGASEKTSGMATEPLQQKVTNNLETNFDIINVNIKSELPSPEPPSAEDVEEMEWTADPKIKIEGCSFSEIEASVAVATEQNQQENQQISPVSTIEATSLDSLGEVKTQKRKVSIIEYMRNCRAEEKPIVEVQVKKREKKETQAEYMVNFRTKWKLMQSNLSEILECDTVKELKEKVLKDVGRSGVKKPAEEGISVAETQNLPSSSENITQPTVTLQKNTRLVSFGKSKLKSSVKDLVTQATSERVEELQPEKKQANVVPTAMIPAASQEETSSPALDVCEPSVPNAKKKKGKKNVTVHREKRGIYFNNPHLKKRYDKESKLRYQREYRAQRKAEKEAWEKAQKLRRKKAQVKSTDSAPEDPSSSCGGGLLRNALMGNHMENSMKVPQPNKVRFSSLSKPHAFKQLKEKYKKICTSAIKNPQARKTALKSVGLTDTGIRIENCYSISSENDAQGGIDENESGTLSELLNNVKVEPDLSYLYEPIVQDIFIKEEVEWPDEFEGKFEEGTEDSTIAKKVSAKKRTLKRNSPKGQRKKTDGSQNLRRSSRLKDLMEEKEKTLATAPETAQSEAVSKNLQFKHPETVVTKVVETKHIFETLGPGSFGTRKFWDQVTYNGNSFVYKKIIFNDKPEDQTTEAVTLEENIRKPVDRVSQMKQAEARRKKMIKEYWRTEEFRRKKNENNRNWRAKKKAEKEAQQRAEGTGQNSTDKGVMVLGQQEKKKRSWQNLKGYMKRYQDKKYSEMKKERELRRLKEKPGSSSVTRHNF